MQIYPDPAGDYSEINISDDNRGETEIYIFDNIGRKISSYFSVKDADEFRYQIPVSALPAGAYYLKVLGGGKHQYTVRMIVR